MSAAASPTRRRGLTITFGSADYRIEQDLEALRPAYTSFPRFLATYTLVHELDDVFGWSVISVFVDTAYSAIVS